MSIFLSPTTNVDKWCILPLYGIPVGAGTALINLVKAFIDLHNIDCSNTMAKLEKDPKTHLKFKAEYNAAFESLWQHLTYIAIGILRIIPFIGGFICLAYHDHQTKLLIESAEKESKAEKFDKSISLYETAIALSGSEDVQKKLDKTKDLLTESKSCKICTDEVTVYHRKNCNENCNKAFKTHEKCLKTWLKQKNQCPHCKIINPLGLAIKPPNPRFARINPQWRPQIRDHEADDPVLAFFNHIGFGVNL